MKTTYALLGETELVVAARELDARAQVPAAEEVEGGPRREVQVLHDVVLRGGLYIGKEGGMGEWDRPRRDGLSYVPAPLSAAPG